MPEFNIYMCGVGGQGIGVLAEILIQACLAGGHKVKSVDTHGLAQRGGIVVSHLRLGENVYTPRITPGEADLVVALERLEGMRAAVEQLRPGGTVIYYDTEYQPIHVRMGRFDYPENEDLAAAVQRRGGRIERVYIDDLPDPRMQNVAVLGRLASLNLIPLVTREIFEEQLKDLIKPAVLEQNLAVFAKSAATATQESK